MMAPLEVLMVRDLPRQHQKICETMTLSSWLGPFTALFHVHARGNVSRFHLLYRTRSQPS